ncbi:hypothetical protein, partial [Paenibacillus lactis]|uniref:hypothetical protein n=1 Tax=Paenibacillus lactis TaxID=228574 RepID=UPI001ABFBB84
MTKNNIRHILHRRQHKKRPRQITSKIIIHIQNPHYGYKVHVTASTTLLACLAPLINDINSLCDWG